MKNSIFLKTFLLTVLFVLSSCATTKYSEEIYKNDYSHLQTGRIYKFGLKGSKVKKKMIFNRTTDTQIIGFANKRDSTIISLDKASVTDAKDMKKTTVKTAAIGIGTAAAAVLIFTSSRAD